MKYIYGPVKSRRLGLSLGVSLTPYKTCSFDCIYCQLGETTEKTSEIKEYVPMDEILGEVRTWAQNNPRWAQEINYLTFSGAGEPTLNSSLGRLIVEIKKIIPAPLCVITNASLLTEPQVRQALGAADLVVPSLDAVEPEIFARIDRPHEPLKIERVIEGLIDFRKEFKGRIWLEVMLVKGVNDDLRHIRKLKEIIERINPDKVQLNSPVRSACESGVLPVDKNKLNKIIKILGDKCEAV